MKLGLVLEGGASRVLFSCGVMDALLEAEIYADYVIGVSAGIAYGTSYVSRQFGRNLELSLDYLHDKRYMGTRHLLNPKKRAFYNKAFAFKEIPEQLVPFDREAFKKYSKTTTSVAGITNIETGEIEYVTLPTDDWDFHIDLLWASCALPYLFQPVELRGKLYMDGGISDPIPYKKAQIDGCDKLITVLTRERNYRKSGEASAKMASRSFRKYTEFSKALLDRPEKYNQSRNELFQMENEGKAFIIAPNDTTGFSRTERRPELLKKMYAEGFETTKALMPKIREYLNK